MVIEQKKKKRIQTGGRMSSRGNPEEKSRTSSFSSGLPIPEGCQVMESGGLQIAQLRVRACEGRPSPLGTRV